MGPSPCTQSLSTRFPQYLNLLVPSTAYVRTPSVAPKCSKTFPPWRPSLILPSNPNPESFGHAREHPRAPQRFQKISSFDFPHYFTTTPYTRNSCTSLGAPYSCKKIPSTYKVLCTSKPYNQNLHSNLKSGEMPLTGPCLCVQ